jgi:acyl carrier protein
VQALEESGAEVLLMSADVCEEEEMREVVRRATERFGQIHGVIHGAGITGAQSIRAIQETNRAECQSQFRPKVYGLYVLEKVLRDEKLDFCVLLSSLSSVLGGLGFAAYAGANQFMDAFARRQNRMSPTAWTSVNWDGWNLSGERKLETAIGATMAELAITPDEGRDAFARILSVDSAAQLIVSTGDLHARFDRWVNLRSSTEGGHAKEGSAATLHARPDLQNDYQGPRDEIERIVTEILQNLLGIEHVGIDDDFFDLGGHSLLATQVVSRVRGTFHVDLPLRSFFETPTVAAWAENIRAHMLAGQSVETLSIVRLGRDGELPLSYAQQRLWFLDQLQPGTPAYNIPAAVRLRGEPDLAALNRTFTEIIRRHEVLRTTFASLNGRPRQVIHPAPVVLIPLLDLSAMPEQERAHEVRRMAQAEAQEPFELEAGPLLRMKLIRESATEHVMLVTMHHIISDGWSLGILVKEVAQLYEGYVKGEESGLAELEIQYADFAAWQREWLQGDVLEAQISYWREQLAGAPPVLALPMSRPRPLVRTFIEDTRPFLLPVDLTAAVKDLGQREDVTLFMIVLAAWQSLLAHYSKQHDIVVGTDIANRNRTETEGLIGFFVNQVVLRTDLSGDPGFHELLKRVRDVTLGAYAHQDLPFEKLVEALNPDRALNSTPLFQAKLVLQNAPTGSLQLPGLTFSALEVKSTTAKFELTLTLWETAEGLAGALGYNMDIYSPAAVTRMVRDFNTVLRTVVAQPDVKLSALGAAVVEEDRNFRVVKGSELQEVGLHKLKNIKRKRGSVLETETGVGLKV